MLHLSLTPTMPSPRHAARALALLLPLAACARAARQSADADPRPTERPVGDAASAYSCAVSAVAQTGYAVPEDVIERARAGMNAGGGSFRAERVTPLGADQAIIDQLDVSVRVRNGGQGTVEPQATLRVYGSRWHEWGAQPRQSISPGARPTPAIPAVRTERPRTGTRRERMSDEVTAADAALVLGSCAGG